MFSQWYTHDNAPVADRGAHKNWSKLLGFFIPETDNECDIILTKKRNRKFVETVYLDVPT